VVGFVDGEGSFDVPIRRLCSGSMPFRVSLSFIDLERFESSLRSSSQAGTEHLRVLRRSSA
jgi:hypothetical protein